MKKLFSILCVCLLSISLCGCSKSPKSAVDTYMKGLKENAKEAVTDYIGGNTSTEALGEAEAKATEEFYKLLMDFDYSTSNEVVNGDTATVDVTVKAYNFGKILTTYIGNAFAWTLQNLLTSYTEEEKNAQHAEMLLEAVSTVVKEGKTIETTVTVSLNKVDGEWVVDEESSKDPLVDAVSGRLKSGIEDLQSKFNINTNK